MSEGVSPSPGGTRPGFSVNTHNLIGGLTVAVLALLFLGYAFYVPNAVIPGLMRYCPGGDPVFSHHR